MPAFPQKGESGDGGDEKGREENKVMILETKAPVDEAADEGSEEPCPEGEVEIADGAAEIEGECDQGGAGRDGETGSSPRPLTMRPRTSSRLAAAATQTSEAEAGRGAG